MSIRGVRFYYTGEFPHQRAVWPRAKLNENKRNTKPLVYITVKSLEWLFVAVANDAESPALHPTGLCSQLTPHSLENIILNRFLTSLKGFAEIYTKDLQPTA